MLEVDSWFHVLHLYHTMCFGKTHTHTICFSCPFQHVSGRPTESKVQFTFINGGCWHKRWIMNRCSRNWFYLIESFSASLYESFISTEDWKQRSLVDGHAPVFMLERSRCCRRKLWPSWPGRCLGWERWRQDVVRSKKHTNGRYFLWYVYDLSMICT